MDKHHNRRGDLPCSRDDHSSLRRWRRSGAYRNGLRQRRRTAAAAPPPRRRPDDNGRRGDDRRSATTAAAPTTTGEPVTLRLGYFPNVTHAPALVGVASGIFADKLGPNVKLETQSFNAGAAAIEALFAGAIDATYIGPNPAINGFAKSKGEALRIVVRRHLGRRVPRGEAGDHERRATSRARSSPRRSSATPRTWRCAPG